MSRTVDELGRTMSSRELTEWRLLYEEEPFGEVRADLQAAMIAQTVANRHLGRRERPHRLKEFMLFWKEPPKSAEDLARKFKGMIPRRPQQRTTGAPQRGDTREPLRSTRPEE